MGLAQFLQDRNRLLAVGAVVVNQSDLLALQLGDPALLLRDVLDGDVGTDPVGSEERKVPGEDGASAIRCARNPR